MGEEERGRIRRKTFKFSFSGDVEGFCCVCAGKTSSFGNDDISGKSKLFGVILGVARALRGGFRRTVIVPGHGGEVLGSIVFVR